MSESEVKSALISATEAVKQKLKDLKKRKFEEEQFYKTTYAPIIGPLEKLVTREPPPPPPPPPPTTPKQAAPTPPLGTTRRPGAPENLYPYEHHFRHTLESSEADEETEHESEEDEEREQEVTADTTAPTKSHYYTEDYVYGPYIDQNTGLHKLGKAQYDRDDRYIYIGKTKKYPVTPGLIELIEAYAPKKSVYTAADKQIYTQEILPETLLHLEGFDPSGTIRSNKGKKYNEIIKPSYWAGKTGRGVQGARSISCRSAGDPNALCKRLRLLLASRQAGHTGHTAEIAGILARLREHGYIE